LSREQWVAGKPELLPLNRQVLDVWDWCGGWNPVLVPSAALYYGVEDLDALMELLHALRGAVDSYHQRQRAART